MKVLLVDDDEISMMILKNMIDTLGHNPICCASGDEALNLIDESIDLVITDWMLPRVSGIELISRIKFKCTAPPPIILMSGIPDFILKEQAKKAGAQSSLSKPYTFDILQDKITSLSIQH